MSGAAAQAVIQITGFVPDSLWWKDGVLFCNDQNGCVVLDGDTGIELTRLSMGGEVQWSPPSGTKHLKLHYINPTAGGTDPGVIDDEAS